MLKPAAMFFAIGGVLGFSGARAPAVFPAYRAPLERPAGSIKVWSSRPGRSRNLYVVPARKQPANGRFGSEVSERPAKLGAYDTLWSTIRNTDASRWSRVAPLACAVGSAALLRTAALGCGGAGAFRRKSCAAWQPAQPGPPRRQARMTHRAVLDEARAALRLARARAQAGTE